MKGNYGTFLDVWGDGWGPFIGSVVLGMHLFNWGVHIIWCWWDITDIILIHKNSDVYNWKYELNNNVIYLYVFIRIGSFFLHLRSRIFFWSPVVFLICFFAQLSSQVKSLNKIMVSLAKARRPWPLWPLMASEIQVEQEHACWIPRDRFSMVSLGFRTHTYIICMYISYTWYTCVRSICIFCWLLALFAFSADPGVDWKHPKIVVLPCFTKEILLMLTQPTANF